MWRNFSSQIPEGVKVSKRMWTHAELFCDLQRFRLGRTSHRANIRDRSQSKRTAGNAVSEPKTIIPTRNDVHHKKNPKCILYRILYVSCLYQNKSLLRQLNNLSIYLCISTHKIGLSRTSMMFGSSGLNIISFR